MSAVNVVVAAVSFIVLLLGKVSFDLMSKELQGQAEQLPYRILRLAARQLPPALRTQYSEDWEAELDHILNRHDACPITRLLLGFRFATSLLRGARHLRVDHTRSLARQSIEQLPDPARAGLIGFAAMLDWLRSAIATPRMRPGNARERRAQNIRNLLWLVGYYEYRGSAHRGFVCEYGPGPVTYIDSRDPQREERALARIERILRWCGYTVERDGDTLEVGRPSWTRLTTKLPG